MQVSDDEKQILAPAIRRACLLTIAWRNDRNIPDLSRALGEMITVTDATDVILALLLIHDNDLLNPLSDTHLRKLAESAASKEGNT